MAQGWVCVHRQLLDNPIFKNDKLFRVFMYCILKASHHSHDQLVGDTIVKIGVGQFVTGRKSISADTGLTEQNVRTALSKLEALGILTSKPTNKFSVISVTNWNRYQQANQQPTSSQPASNQQVTTNNNGNNGDNDNNQDDGTTPGKPSVPLQQVLDSYHELLPMMATVQIYSDKRKSMVRTFWKRRSTEYNKSGREYTIEHLRGYLSYIADKCQWMHTDRPNGKGGFWKAKNFDYIFKDDCYIAVKEQRHDDRSDR